MRCQRIDHSGCVALARGFTRECVRRCPKKGCGGAWDSGKWQGCGGWWECGGFQVWGLGFRVRGLGFRV